MTPQHPPTPPAKLQQAQHMQHPPQPQQPPLTFPYPHQEPFITQPPLQQHPPAPYSQPAPFPAPYPPPQPRPSPSFDRLAPAANASQHPDLPPLNPVFGVSLEDLFRRDGTAIPMIVYQCIQAVELFGLSVEGIYRLSGNTLHIQRMKALFDNGTFLKLKAFPFVQNIRVAYRKYRFESSRFHQSRELLSRCQ